MTLLRDTCHPAQESAPTENVVETSTEVRVTLAMRMLSGGRDDCAGAATIELDTAIGARTVVDARTGRRFDAGLAPPQGAPAQTTTSPPTTSAQSEQPSDGGVVQYASVLGTAPLCESRHDSAERVENIDRPMWLSTGGVIE